MGRSPARHASRPPPRSSPGAPPSGSSSPSRCARPGRGLRGRPGMRHEAERAGAPLARSADAPGRPHRPVATSRGPRGARGRRGARAAAGPRRTGPGRGRRPRFGLGGGRGRMAGGAGDDRGRRLVAARRRRRGVRDPALGRPDRAAAVARARRGAVGEDLWPLAALVGRCAILGAAARVGLRRPRGLRAARRRRRGRGHRGRPPAPVPVLGGARCAALAQAVAALTARAAELQDAAEARVEALGAVLGPMDHPAAARTPAGSLIRNDALERLVRDAPAGRRGPRSRRPSRPGLESTGPVSRRLSLVDGRDLEVNAWSVPGGRVVTVGERTEQARLAALRRQLTGVGRPPPAGARERGPGHRLRPAGPGPGRERAGRAAHAGGGRPDGAPGRARSCAAPRTTRARGPCG